jgi:hypothetical protein
MTQRRFCDYCGELIEGDYLKVALSKWVKSEKKYSGHRTLTHHADMCLGCDERLRCKKEKKKR